MFRQPKSDSNGICELSFPLIPPSKNEEPTSHKEVKPPHYESSEVNQPAAAVLGFGMQMPQVPPNCPPGLEYLSMIDQLLVHQKVEMMEILIGFETNNKYTIKNSLGQKVYYAVEDTDCLTRNCCGPMRPFEMKIFDNMGTEVIHLERSLACASCCCPCCLQCIEVYSPPGIIVGIIEQEWKIFGSKFAVKNPNGETVLRIQGPCCPISCCNDVDFHITTVDQKMRVGKISKQWAGLLKEMFTDSDYFGITFPMDLDVRMKAVLLGACFLIDFMYFETDNSAFSALI